ncbi:hypothetical protein Poly51_08710 [Rubripirellula tenax]|uniref:DUF2267 domain-containing protein n=1 Tax=Rubripirellula tenax TaxID=2528015 RepID=A0A5C6FJ35_9BACT|nr:DUF2780 domain-containing protein [Rubripirellula tenax]TWU60593.1 hypothetical protein Poly51_08710 [Rubripirellula tenax]
MDELIAQLTSKLGIDESVANAATGKAMALVKQHAGDELFGKIASAIPGAVESAATGASDAGSDAASGGAGMLGKLAGMASSALGGSAGGGLELGAALTGAGLEPDKMGGFVSMIVGFLKEKAGAEVMDQVMAKFPMLKTLLG